MILRPRPARIGDRALHPRPGFEHLSPSSLAVLGWLTGAHVDFVLVGPVAEAIRGSQAVAGPVVVVPAPYGRNLDRLGRALMDNQARLRVDAGSAVQLARLDRDRLQRGQLLRLRCGEHDIDVDPRRELVSSYPDLLYEATAHEPAEGVTVQVAGLEDLERYAQMRVGRPVPEILIRRQRPPAPAAPAPGPAGAHRTDR